MQLAQQTNIHTMQKQITTKANTDPRQKSSKPTALKCNNYYITTKCSHLPRCTYLLCIIMASQYCLCVTRRSSLEGSVTCISGDQLPIWSFAISGHQLISSNQQQTASANDNEALAYQRIASKLVEGEFQLPGGGLW